MSIAESVIRLVEDAARRAEARSVRSVVLEIGELASVVPESLQFCFAAVAAGSVAAGARLEIVPLPGRLRCRDCAHEFPGADLFGECPGCGSLAVDVIAGREMRVREIEIEGET